MTARVEAERAILICDLTKKCADANVNRWHCMRGHALPEENKPATAGVCPLTVCDRRGANPDPKDTRDE